MAGEGATPDEGSGERVDPSFAYAAFDALPTELAILDEDGEIVYTNRAWREFGEANDLRTAPDTIGVNYLAVCEGSEGETAARAARGIRAVLAGGRSTTAASTTRRGRRAPALSAGYRPSASTATASRKSVNGSRSAGETVPRPGSNSTAPASRSFGRWKW